MNSSEDDTRKKTGPLSTALSGAHLRRAGIVAIVVGTVLNAINQGDARLAGDEVNLAKIALTYFVPFAVSTYGAYSALADLDDR